MFKHEVIIQHNDGNTENTTRLGYSASHVMDLLNKEYSHGSFTVIPPLKAHRHIAIMVYTSQGQKAFALDELNISADDYTGRRQLSAIVQQQLDDKKIFNSDYDFYHLVN